MFNRPDNALSVAHFQPSILRGCAVRQVRAASLRPGMTHSKRRRALAYGARLEVARDNMGHAGSTGSITLDVYSKTWWNERVEAVSRVVEAVFAEPDDEEKKSVSPLKDLPKGG